MPTPGSTPEVEPLLVRELRRRVQQLEALLYQEQQEHQEEIAAKDRYIQELRSALKALRGE
jgi:hypothetical protein